MYHAVESHAIKPLIQFTRIKEYILDKWQEFNNWK